VGHGRSVSQDGATDLVKTALDRGINFIDTADFYSNGRSEVVTGNALQDAWLPRDSYVLATKVLLRMGRATTRSACRARTSCKAWIRA
jgi:aryl-alcohol dehydrogenase-like predicted oxidoreductase